MIQGIFKDHFPQASGENLPQGFKHNLIVSNGDKNLLPGSHPVYGLRFGGGFESSLNGYSKVRAE